MASKGINRVILVGNLGKDPEIRYMPSGGAVANFNIATSESWKDKATGEQKEKTEWHNISIFGKLAEIAGEYVRKGSQVYIEGQLQTRKWQDQSGNDRYTTEVVVQGFNGVMQMLGGKAESNQRQQNQQPQQQQQQGGFNQAPQQQGGFQQQQSQQSAQQQRQRQKPQQQQQNQPQPQQGGHQNQPNPTYNQAQNQGGFQQQAPAQQQPNTAPDLDEGWDDDVPF